MFYSLKPVHETDLLYCQIIIEAQLILQLICTQIDTEHTSPKIQFHLFNPKVDRNTA